MDIHNELLESLENCVKACNYCAASCLDEENVQPMTDCIKLDLDCADSCHLALKLLVRNITPAVSIIEFCKEICAECAAECEKHDHDHCQQCAKACRRCEDQCNKYLDRIANADTV
ncbi:four-helix bundle copper-binding protein [Rhodohalobacter sp. SW132]|nr:four-helix bundle copper-binding protein [Rhodohalobacter sp. SW132]